MKIIVAQDRKGAIGNKGGLLVKIPTDMKHFREMTTGGTVVMGRKTLESFPGKRPLAKRRNIVMSRTLEKGEGYEVCRSREELLLLLGVEHTEGKVFVIGGAEIYTLLMDICDGAIVTEIDGEFEADTFIPIFANSEHWQEISKSLSIKENNVTYRFVEYRRT